MIIFGEKDIYTCNLGDSKIYRCDNKNLTQISKDHVIDIFNDRKPPLSQFLGIPESEFIIEPYITHGAYNDGDLYLICSDGLTDMISENMIKNILAENKDVKICVDILLEKALANGGTDNITVILCKIKKKKNKIFRKFFDK
jgi:protein phosphatase